MLLNRDLLYEEPESGDSLSECLLQTHPFGRIRALPCYFNYFHLILGAFLFLSFSWATLRKLFMHTVVWVFPSRIRLAKKEFSSKSNC